MTQTQEMIARRVSKIHECILGDVYEGESFLRKELQNTTHFIITIKSYKLEQQNKGPGMSRGWSLIMPMMSCDVT